MARTGVEGDLSLTSEGGGGEGKEGGRGGREGGREGRGRKEGGREE